MNTLVSGSLDDSMVTFVVPTYEKHLAQFCDLVDSVDRHCIDKDRLRLIVILEEKNIPLFEQELRGRLRANISFVTTEDVLKRFSLKKTPTLFLKDSGKFTFQSLKKLGGLLKATSKWCVVLDSETIFFRDFSVQQLVTDYEKKKYVFYTRTSRRGHGWNGGLVDNVTRQCGQLLDVSSGDRSYMELIIWFFETEKVHELIQRVSVNLKNLLEQPSVDKPIFENVLYYLFLEKFHGQEYNFVDFEKEWKRLVPDEISGRYDLESPPLSFCGADHVTYTIAPGETSKISGFLEEYNIPFLRVEPFIVNAAQLEEYKRLETIVAFVSSAHLAWLNQKIAVCISGEFKGFPGSLHRLRHVVGFLTGCECDIFVHGWRNPDEGIILDALKPKGYIFEAKPVGDIQKIESGIVYKERGLKPGRDFGSLSMFYGMKQCFKLVEESDGQYDFVLRIRPDLYLESSLTDILRGITMAGDANLESVYVPRHYHSQGINDQIALGGFEAMTVYMRTYDFIADQVENLYFNPEAILLKNLLNNDVSILPIDLRYALMRYDGYHAESVSHVFARQDSIWWSSVDDFPAYEPANEFFEDKLKCVEFLSKRKKHVSDLFLYLNATLPGALDVCSVSWRESNPCGDLTMLAHNNQGPAPVVYPTRHPVSLSKNGVAAAMPGRRYIFCYPSDDETLVIAEWRRQGDGRFAATRTTISLNAVSASYWEN